MTTVYAPLMAAGSYPSLNNRRLTPVTTSSITLRNPLTRDIPNPLNKIPTTATTPNPKDHQYTVVTRSKSKNQQQQQQQVFRH